MNSSTEFTCKVEFAFSAVSRTARSVPPQESTAWKPDDVCDRVAYCNTTQTKAVGRQLGNLGDGLIARKFDRGNMNCSRRLKIGFIIIFYVGVFAKFASSVWSFTTKGIDWKDIMEAVTERLLKMNHACTSFLNITWKNRKGCYSGIAVGIWLLSKAR